MPALSDLALSEGGFIFEEFLVTLVSHGVPNLIGLSIWGGVPNLIGVIVLPYLALKMNARILAFHPLAMMQTWGFGR